MQITYLVFGLLWAYGADTPSHLTVEQAVTLALDSHPAMQQAKYIIEEFRGEALQAGLPPNPAIEVGLEGWGEGKQGEHFIGITQTLPISGARAMARKAKTAGVTASEQEMEWTRRQIILEVESLFYQIVALQEQLQFLEASVESAQKTDDLMRFRYEVGDISEIDWRRASANLSQLLANQEEVRETLIALRTQLAHLCGTEDSKLPECVGSLELSQDEAEACASLFEQIQFSPRHQALALRTKEAEIETDTVKRESIPEPALRLGLRKERSGSTGVDLMLSWDLPVFNRNQGAHAAAQAKVQRQKAEHRIALLEDKRRIEQLLGDIRVALAKAARLRSQALPNLEQTSTALQQALELGAATIFEVIETLQELNDLRRTLSEVDLKVRLAYVELKAMR